MNDTLVLTIRLEGPMQAWGGDAKWDYRPTDLYPTKSGVVGLLGCALGLERGNAQLSELASALTMAVRADRPGQRITDYQTVTGEPLRNAEGNKRSGGQTFISRREYLSDASFLVALRGPKETICRLIDALKAPHWPYYLGRKNCVPSRPVFEPGKRPYDSLSDALAHHSVASRTSAASNLYGCESEEELPDSGILVRSDQPAGNTERHFELRKVYRRKVQYVPE